MLCSHLQEGGAAALLSSGIIAFSRPRPIGSSLREVEAGRPLLRPEKTGVGWGGECWGGASQVTGRPWYKSPPNPAHAPPGQQRSWVCGLSLPRHLCSKVKVRPLLVKGGPGQFPVSHPRGRAPAGQLRARARKQGHLLPSFHSGHPGQGARDAGTHEGPGLLDHSYLGKFLT